MNLFMKKCRSLLLTLFVAAGILGGMGTLQSLAADQDIVILFTNDIHCGVNDNIGYAGVALYKKEMLKETPYVTLVDAGDAVQGAPLGTLSEGEDIVAIMNEMGYEFAIPGNHEFDYKMPQFMRLASLLNCGYYSANFTDASGNRIFAPYKLFQYGDTKLAMVGVTTPESFTKSTPVYFQDEAGNYIYGFSEDETGEKLYAAVQDAVDSARNEGAEIVILVGHLGRNYVTERWSSESVLANTTGIDALNVFPFGNSVCMVEATGQQIKDALEMGVRNLPEETGGFQQVSGMSFTVDTSIPSGVELDEKGNFVRVNGSYRVQDLMIGGKPVDLSASYKVASHNYMLLSGGDGMTMFAGCSVLMRDITTDVDALYTYINQDLGGVIGEEYADPRGQGRITIR